MHDGKYIFKRQPFQLPSFSLDVTTDVTEDLSSNDKIDVPSMAPVAPASKAAPVAPASKAPLKENSMIFNDLQSLFGLRDLFKREERAKTMSSLSSCSDVSLQRKRLEQEDPVVGIANPMRSLDAR